MKISQIIGRSRPIEELRDMITQAAKSDASVLIMGESGTGKELVASALHGESSRTLKPFVPVNCGAIPSELLESELFGHKKGAFTGAITDRKGRFELAQQGTLFLDEIGDMPLEMQVKLLRVLQEKQIDPVGATRPVTLDVRVIAATHRNLAETIKSGDFRDDLFYRLNVIPIYLPSLRERRGDIPILIEEFLKHYNHRNGYACFDSDLMEIMCAYDWPGNVRELVNLVHRLSCFFPNQKIKLAKIPPSLLPVQMVGRDDHMGFFSESVDTRQTELDFALYNEEAENPVEDIILKAQGYDSATSYKLTSEGVGLKEHLAQIEKDLISQALHESGGNVSQSARALKMQRTTDRKSVV